MFNEADRPDEYPPIKLLGQVTMEDEVGLEIEVETSTGPKLITTKSKNKFKQGDLVEIRICKDYNWKRERVLCAICNKPIHIDDFGGIDKRGLLHNLCITEDKM